MREKSVRLAKLRRRLVLWAKIVLNETIAPLVDRSALLQILMVPFLLYLAFKAGGDTAFLGRWSESQTALMALVLALPAFLLLNCARALYLAKDEEAKMGAWHGRQFILHEPRVVLTTKITAENNCAAIPIRLDDVEGDGSAELRIEADIWDKDALVQISMNRDGPLLPWQTVSLPTIALIRVPSNRTLFLFSQKRTPSNASTIRVYLLSFYIV